jgi:hypothetical protein
MMFFDMVMPSELHVGEDGYIPLYPLLAKFWDKLLAAMPEKLRQRVKDAVPSWDEIADQDSILHKTGELTTRQKRIRWFDIKRDDTQEWRTYIALQGYIQGGYARDGYPSGEYVPDGKNFRRGYLPKNINRAMKDNNESIANVLHNDVALPLEQICRDVGIHWPDPEPVLWKSLCKFREFSLSRLVKEAEEKNDEQLVEELKFVSIYIHKILSLDRHRMSPQIESEWKANAVAQASVVTDQPEREKEVGIFREYQLLRLNALNSSLKMSEKAYSDPPGKTDKIKGITKLAIKAAWKIECDTGRQALALEVIKLLHSWVDKEEILLEKMQDGVIWQTTRGKLKPFELAACGLALKRWNNSRQ